jgi:hypothetical protein
VPRPTCDSGHGFAALSMAINLVSAKSQTEFQIFVVPNILYFVSSLLLSCVMLAPFYTPLSLALVLLLGGMYGLGRTYGFVSQLIRAAKKYQDFTLSDWLAQIIAPLGAYVLILIAALCFALNQEALALDIMWVAVAAFVGYLEHVESGALDCQPEIA